MSPGSTALAFQSFQYVLSTVASTAGPGACPLFFRRNFLFRPVGNPPLSSPPPVRRKSPVGAIIRIWTNKTPTPPRARPPTSQRPRYGHVPLPLVGEEPARSAGPYEYRLDSVARLGRDRFHDATVPGGHSPPPNVPYSAEIERQRSSQALLERTTRPALRERCAGTTPYLFT